MYMKGKIGFVVCVCALILVCLTSGIILSIAPTVSADEEEFTATVIDTAGSETNVYDLYLYHRWCIIPGYPKCTKYESSSKKSIMVKKGESKLTIPFGNIEEMVFEWGETEDVHSVTITLLEGKKIEGLPLDSKYRFEGKTDYGDFELPMTKTKKVIFSHAITPTSTTPTVTQTSSPAATPALVPTSAQTPTSSPDQIPTPIPKPAGFEAVFALVGLVVVTYLIRKRIKI